MRWTHGPSPASQVDLEADYKAAQNLGKVRLGAQWLFFPKFSGTSYLPYTDISRIWLRQEEVTAKMCCGRANFDQFYLMVIDQQGQLHRGHVDDMAKGKEALARIPQYNSAVHIGKPQD